MVAVPAEYHDLFERQTFAHFASLLPDGRPHVTPVWVGYDDEANRLEVNTERDRQKAKNVERDPRVALSLTDPEDPYRRLVVVGEVETATTEGAREHIDQLARRYTGDDYGSEVQSERLLLRIRPDRVL
jgi:PPOX class probable F420-dependent enzyme